MVRQLYLAATGQNRGKTTVSLGLVDGFRRRGLHTGFIKPVGQRTVLDGGQPADEDAVLMKSIFDLPEPYSVMSPVHIPRGFTKAYIAGQVVEDLGARIAAAHRQFADHELLLIEGTGHAGVGAVVGLSNAVVAAMLGAPAVIVSEGGVGRPIDEIVLNASHFQAHGVRVAGAIVNKVRVDEQPGIEETLRRGLARHGIPLLGVLPYRPILSNPTLGMIEEGVHGRVVSQGHDPESVIGSIAIGAMEPHHMLERVGPTTLVIVPGDREDVILTLTSAHATTSGIERLVEGLVEATPGAIEARPDQRALGMVLTGGYEPRPEVMDAIRRSGMFAVFVEDDTYTVASEIHDLLVKTHAADAGKIELIKALVWEGLKLTPILDAASDAVFA
ncbi:MAG TPA: AAA family ATPase [Candidatus Limnocylindrales bacterium]|nr:AAA family ATPase [Candidatus Limnocylindrales bacterium]